MSRCKVDSGKYHRAVGVLIAMKNARLKPGVPVLAYFTHEPLSMMCYMRVFRKDEKQLSIALQVPVNLQGAEEEQVFAVRYNNKSALPDAQLEFERHNCSLNSSGLAACRNTQFRRQLRIVFIYPLVYTLMWFIPFPHHCTTSNDKYPQRPLWALRLGVTVCVSSMGFIDCLAVSI